MAEDFPRSTARIGGHPVHPMLVPIPITCFIGTLITDLAYWRTGDLQWANFSDWLLTMGLIGMVLAAIAGIIDFLGDRRIPGLAPAWIHAIGNTLVLVLAIFNEFVHTRDAYGQMPAGLILSLSMVVILVVTGWNGWEMVYRHGVAIRPERGP